MEPPVVPDGEVTRGGAGHRAVSLVDVEKARRASVLAYCARICDPARIAEAADAAFAELESRLEAAPSYEVVDLDRALLEATRDAAAERVGDPTAAAAGRLLSRRSTNTCALMPTMLAARESGRLSATDRAAVERHIAKCPACRDQEQRRDEAEQAYTALIGAPVELDAAAEPFAPGDPEPEVSVSRSEGPEPELAEPEAAEPEAAEPDAGLEPSELDDAQPEDEEEFDLAFDLQDEPDSRLLDPPEFEGPLVYASGNTEEFDVQAALDREDRGLDPDDPRTKLPTWRDGAPIGGNRTARRGPSRGLILALFLAGVVILAIGLLQIGGDDGSDGTSNPRASRQSVAAPAPTTQQPAAPQPTKAELRQRARLRSLGDRELSRGTEGADVKALQKLLGVSATGTFGELTEFAVKDFQTEHGLPATGVADAATKRKLARRSKPPRQAPTPPAPQGTQGQTTTPATPQDQTPQTPATPPPAQAPSGQATPGQ